MTIYDSRNGERVAMTPQEEAAFLARRQQVADATTAKAAAKADAKARIRAAQNPQTLGQAVLDLLALHGIGE